MKYIVISLLLIFALASGTSADESSENYSFVHDLFTCLYRLQLAALDTIEGVENELVVRNLYNQLPNLLKSKGYMHKWLEDDDNAIKATAMGMYMDISNIEDAVRALISMLEAPEQADIPKIAMQSSQMTNAWNEIFQTSGLAVWVIAQPADSDNPQGKIPFILSDQERQRLVKYVNKMFEDEFKEFEEFINQKANGTIDEFKLSVPVWSALHLRNILATETYEKATTENLLTKE